MTDTQPRPHTELRGTASAEFQPILPGFHPDPTVCRVGDDYYLASSSFEYFPGVPIFHSTDLVSWAHIGHALHDRGQFRKGITGPSSGIFAPTLRHRDGRFWMITTNVSSFDDGQVIVHATDPAGSWSEPVFVREAIGIDPDLAWDDDGTCYLTWHDLDFVRGGKGIIQAPVDPMTGELLAPAYPVWQGSGMVAAEGPHLHRVGNWWYLMLAEGGTERGHSVTIARAPHPSGPYEACPHNPILTRRSTGHPVQNTGHADFVERSDGSWAAVYLGVRVQGSTPGFHVLGRETFLAGVQWVDGWPQFDVGHFDVPFGDTAFTDEFDGETLDPRWVAPSSEPSAVASFECGRGLELRPSSGENHAMLCARVRDLSWSAQAIVEGDAGMRVRIDDRHWYGVERDRDVVVARARVGDVYQELGSVAVDHASVTLGISTAPAPASSNPGGPQGPDVIVLSATISGVTTELGRLDGRYLSTEVAAGFTGRMLALVPGSRPARVSRVTYTPIITKD